MLIRRPISRGALPGAMQTSRVMALGATIAQQLSSKLSETLSLADFCEGDGTDESAKAQAAADYLGNQGGGVIRHPRNFELRVDVPVDLPDGVRWIGEGETSVIYNPQTDANVDNQVAFRLGNGHPAMWDSRNDAANRWAQYGIAATPAGSYRVTLDTAADAANWAVGDFITLLSSDVKQFGASSPNYYVFPHYVHVTLVVSIDADNGYIYLLDPTADEFGDTAVAMVHSATDAYMSAPYRYVKYAEIRDISIDARALSSRTATYGLKISGIRYRTTPRILFPGNGHVNADLSDIVGPFGTNFVEWKMGAQRVNARGFYGINDGASALAADGFGVSLGEGACDLTMRDFRLTKDDRRNGSAFYEFQNAGGKRVLTDGFRLVRRNTGTNAFATVLGESSLGFASEDTTITNSHFDIGTDIVANGVFIGSTGQTAPPKRTKFTNNNVVGSFNSSSGKAIKDQGTGGGSGVIVTGNTFPPQSPVQLTVSTDVVADMNAGGASRTPIALAKDGSASWIPDAGNYRYRVTVSGALTIAAAINPSDGQRLRITVIQDGTGSFAITWGTVYKFNIAAWTNTGNTANKRSTVEFEYDAAITAWVQAAPQTSWQ